MNKIPGKQLTRLGSPGASRVIFSPIQDYQKSLPRAKFVPADAKKSIKGEKKAPLRKSPEGLQSKTFMYSKSLLLKKEKDIDPNAKLRKRRETFIKTDIKV